MASMVSTRFSTLVESLHGERKHGVESKQRLEVELLPIVNIVAIQGQHSSLANIEPGTEQNPELQREILCEYILCPGRGLDLDETPASFREPLNHVRSSKHAAVLERGFEEGWHRFVLNDPLSFFEGLCDLPVILRDQYSAGMTLAGQFPDFRACVKDGLQGSVGFGCQSPCEGVIPEPQMALQAGDVAGLGKEGIGTHANEVVRTRE